MSTLGPSPVDIDELVRATGSARFTSCCSSSISLVGCNATDSDPLPDEPPRGGAFLDLGAAFCFVLSRLANSALPKPHFRLH
ncbi:MAG: hypothetical protein WB662_09900 [Methyloceanibacter sp.]